MWRDSTVEEIGADEKPITDDDENHYDYEQALLEGKACSTLTVSADDLPRHRAPPIVPFVSITRIVYAVVTALALL